MFTPSEKPRINSGMQADLACPTAWSAMSDGAGQHRPATFPTALTDPAQPLWVAVRRSTYGQRSTLPRNPNAMVRPPRAKTPIITATANLPHPSNVAPAGPAAFLTTPAIRRRASDAGRGLSHDDAHGCRRCSLRRHPARPRFRRNSRRAAAPCHPPIHVICGQKSDDPTTPASVSPQPVTGNI